MLYSFHSVEYQLYESPYFRSDGVSFPHTAKAEFKDERGKVLLEKSYGYLTLAELYDLIGQENPIDIDECLIYNFSLTACRRYLLQDKNARIALNNFSARGTLFISALKVDFSIADFTGTQANFDGAVFVCNELTFHASRFMETGAKFQNAVFKTEQFDFTRASVTGGDFTFKNAAFAIGKKDFQDAKFNNNEVCFINTDFGDGDTSFINATFANADTSFKVARFGYGKVDFHFAKFNRGDISFERTEFGNGRSDFRTVEFGSGKINFNRCTFGDGDVSFEGASSNGGKLLFRRSTFGIGEVGFEIFEGKEAEIIFEKVDFEKGSLSFSGAMVRNLTLSSCLFSDRVNLQVAYAEAIDISDSIVRDIVDFRPHEQMQYIGTLDISGLKLLGRIYIDWQQNSAKQLVHGQANSSDAEKAGQFLILKENFNALGQYEDEDRAYVEYRRCEQRAKFQRQQKGKLIDRITAYPRYWSKLILYDLMGLYATRPSRVFLSMMSVYLLFSGVFMLFITVGEGNINPSGIHPDTLTVMERSLYHSAITFFTIGYGDFYPSGPLRIVCGVEGFVGVFLMAYFTVAFVRKILR
ncbi:MAG TPA: potassium channel family protein [Williamwhitmania sp.]|nr:potassium channel family protein [Williamwhitmania sp.]